MGPWFEPGPGSQTYKRLSTSLGLFLFSALARSAILAPVSEAKRPTMSNIFWSKVFKQGLSEVDQIAELWQKTPLFSGIPMRQTRMLSAKMHVRQFQAEEIVFHQGDQAAGAILVLDGSIRIKVRNKELALLESGDFFGEIALAEAEKRITDAVAIEDSRLVFFFKQDIEEWIDFEPRLGARFLLNLSSVLAHRLFEANTLLADEKSSY